MRNHYIAAFIIALVVFIITVVSFSLTGSPLSQKDLRLDEMRISQFSSLKYKFEDYYRDHKKLPTSLSELTLTQYEKIDDPESKKPFDYKVTGSGSYQLCTTFSTDSAKVAKKKGYSDYLYSSTENKHKKGYDCITYKLPDYMTQPYDDTSNPTPYVSPPPLSSVEVANNETACSSAGGTWDDLYKGCRFASCKDTDNTYGSESNRNNSLYTKGTVTFGDHNSLIPDSCNNSSVMEFECVDNTQDPKGGYFVRGLTDLCPKGCDDGACAQ